MNKEQGQAQFDGMIRSFQEAALCEAMTRYAIPGYMHDGLANYIVRGRPVGHFLTAILSNDLKEAVARADEENQRAIVAYVKFLTNEAPSGCWGREGAVRAWSELGGLYGEWLK